MAPKEQKTPWKEVPEARKCRMTRATPHKSGALLDAPMITPECRDCLPAIRAGRSTHFNVTVISYVKLFEDIGIIEAQYFRASAARVRGQCRRTPRSLFAPFALPD